jgi:signal-transduction protein with cAMP-binding, CBS, and nucleotidyltransferase domain
VNDSLSFEDRMAALEKIPLFAYLGDEERLLLLSEMQTYYFEDGKTLVRQGEVGDEFFVLVKGAANVIFVDPKGTSHLLVDLGVGDAFGEIALIDDVPRMASIVSDGGCIALGLKKEGFERFALSLGTPDRVKTMIRLTSFFRRHPLFSKLGAKDQAELIDSVTFETITAGDEVPEGDERFRVIYSGKLRMDTGDDAADTELEADDCFGYASTIRAKFFAIEGAGILSVNKDDFSALVWEKLVERPELFV